MSIHEIETTRLTTDTDESGVLLLPVGRTAYYAIDSNALDGAEVQVLASRIGRGTWEVKARHTDDAVGQVLNDSAGQQWIKFRLVQTDETLTGNVDVTAFVTPAQISVIRDPQTNDELAVLQDNQLHLKVPAVLTLPRHADDDAASAAGLADGVLYINAAGAVAVVGEEA